MLKYALGLYALAVATTAMAAPHYRLIDLTPASTALPNAPRAISDSGKIIGETGGAGVNHLVRLDGTAAVLPTLAGGTNTVTRGINNAGIAAATVQTVGGDDRAALIGPGGAVQLGGIAGYAAAGALGINNHGVATGYVLSSGQVSGLEGGFPVNSNNTLQRAVVWTNGVATILSDGNGAIRNAAGQAINASGQIAGSARLADNSRRAVTWLADGTLSILSLDVGEVASRARAINAAGDVAGQVTAVRPFGEPGQFITQSVGAVWHNGLEYRLDNGAGQDNGTTRGINRRDDVVGFTTVTSGTNDNPVFTTVGRFWSLSGEVYTGVDLDSLVVNLGVWHTGAVQAINDRGQIVGFDTALDGSSRAYLLTPVPEPGTWSLLIVGFAITGIVARRRSLTALPAL